MADTLQTQIGSYRSRLDGLIRRGLDIRDALADDDSDSSALAAARVWQQDCGVVVNELSGGSKAHWLARAFSEAFLVRAPGAVVEGVTPAEIVQRLIGVLEQALASLSQADVPARIESSQAAEPHRFDFVHDVEIRPILEQAYIDGSRAFEAGEYELALKSYCGVLEAIVTDALQKKGLKALSHAGAPLGEIASWSFESRLAVAEKSGLIGRGGARLPEVAWKYRDTDEGLQAQVSERDARVTGQVLHVLMRDLNPGR